MGIRMCRKGKSCGATCIDPRERCNLELGPLVSASVSKVSLNLGAIFMRQIEDGKKKAPASLPSDLRRQLFALPGPEKNTLEKARARQSAAQKGKDPAERWAARKGLAEAEKKAGIQQKPVEPRNLDRSPGAETRTAPRVRRELANIAESAKKGEMTLMMDDISRIMRGSIPENIQVASAKNELGMKVRTKGSGPTWNPGSMTGNTRWARSDADDFDGSFKIYKRIRGDKAKIDWDESVMNGKKIGEGSFGTVLKVGNVAHKRGEVSADEANIIKKAGELGIGPRLLGAEISTKKREGYGVDLHNGRIAMSVVPGKQMGDVQPDSKVAGKNVSDIYWKAMADLHRAGIAHNDAHVENILIDNKGKGRWVDFGLAQDNPRAALAEAMGSFKPLKGGDDITVPGSARGNGNWQARGWDATGYKVADAAKQKGGKTWEEFQQRFPVTARVWKNQDAVVQKLEKKGLDVNEINSMIEHGIRSPLSSYNASAGFSKITDKQAQELLNTFYDGI